ncbi:MAG: choice-of-anchor L domain-containing protein [Lewinellaceae bacterium]|nr:choice-of-anchor L domain-containing protein [Lewinellaceae bacterium]
MALLALPALLPGQPLEVNNAPPITPENLITNIFLGEGVEVLDVQFQGSPSAVGFFQHGDDEIGLDRGIVMSSGAAVTVPGQVGVDSPGGAQASEPVSGLANDPDMAALSGTNDINDLVAYTITFIPISDTLRFRYVFASEEYPEYVCSEFNDVFGFFISGPGINGPFSNNAENIALIPETNLPVAINNVNSGTVGNNGMLVNCTPPNGSLAYSQYYNNNNGSTNRPVYDGFTDVFTAEALVYPCSTYTIKLVICDVADDFFDSGVFLEAKSFGTGSLDVEAATVSLDGSVAEGCTAGELIFSLPVPTESDYPIDYHLLGTAENGVDYEYIPPDLFIPAGDSVLSIPIVAIEDGLAEGTETLVIDVQRDPCNRDTIIVPIKENVLLPPELQPDTSICRGEQVMLDGTVNVPLPPPPTFYNQDPLVISPHNVTLYSDIEVFGVLPPTLGPGVIRSVCIEDLQTTWVDDLRIYLISPGGQFMELVTDIGNAGDNFIGTCFTPDATTPITSLGAADQPFTGEFAPEGVWEDLYGDDSPVNGTWQLAVFDKFFADTPVLNRWSITFTPLYEIGYSWQPADGLSCQDCSSVLANPDTTTNFTLEAIDSYGCTTYDSIAIEVLSELEAPQLSCAAVTDNSITVAWPGVPGAMGYEVNIDNAGWMPANGTNEHTVSGLPLSTTVHFQVRAIGQCGSLISDIECMTPDCVPPSAQAVSVTEASCFGSADGGITLSASGGVAPYQFIVNGQSNLTGIFTGLPADTYQVQVVDDAGCPASLQVVVGQPDSLEVIRAISAVSCNGLSDGQATLSINGGIGPYDFNWSDGQTDSVATGLSAGIYQLQLTDANSCSYSYELEVVEPEPLTLEVTTDSVRCAGAANGTAAVIASGGVGGYSYDFGAGVIVGTSPGQAVGLLAGSYEVTVSDGNGCEEAASFLIEEPLPLQAQFAVADASCADSATASVSAMVSGGTGSYSYSWRDTSMSVIGLGPGLSGIAAGQYVLEITDANGCILEEEAMVGEPEPLDYFLDVQPASCPGVADGSAGLLLSGGEPGYSYNWNDIGVGPSARTGLAAGNYTVTVTDLNGCSLEIQLQVDSPQPIALEFSSVPASCTGISDGMATVVPSGGAGGYSYLWENGQNAPTATGLPPGQVSVVVSDANGCQANGMTEIGEAVPVSVEVAGDGPSCNGGGDGMATATATGGTGTYTYIWSNGQSGPSVSGLAAGAHFVTVTDGNGCIEMDTILLEEPEALENTFSTQAATCNPQPDGSAFASVQGGTPPYSYSWSDGQSQATAQNLEMGTYMLTVADAEGCVLLDTVLVDGIPAISLALEKQDVSCNGGADGSVTAVVSGGSGNYSFDWSHGAPSGPQAVNLVAGVYSLTVMDGLGCTAMASVTVGEPAAIQLETVAGRVSCSGDMDGTLSLSISGGMAPYNILWSTGETGLELEGLGVGAYSVTVTDANGCRANRTDQVLEASPIDVSLEIEAVKCYGESDGSVQVQASGGLPPFVYHWPDGSTGSVLDNLAAGSYALSITDAAGCEVVEELEVGQPSLPLQATVAPFDVSCFGKHDGRIEIETTGGTPFYRYSLDGEFFSGSNIFIGLEPGLYTVQARDYNGCTFRSEPVRIGEPGPIVVELGETLPVNFGESVQLQPEITGGAGMLGYSWEPADSSLLSCFDCREPLATVTTQVSLRLVVTDEKGCEGEDIVNVYPEKVRPVFVPTGFTPNGDGSNDKLLVHAKEDIEIRIRYFRVYDRWGELVFTANEFKPNDVDYGWDGTFRGQPVSGGVYIWHLGVEFIDGYREEFTGHTTLIR